MDQIQFRHHKFRTLSFFFHFFFFRNVTFNSVGLTGLQNDTVDFIVDQMVLNMRTIVNQNNPVLLVQYCTAVLSYLNIQSGNNVSTIEKRMAIREVIAKSLAGLPRSSIHSIQQLSSAIKYLTVCIKYFCCSLLANLSIFIYLLFLDYKTYNKNWCFYIVVSHFDSFTLV